MGHAILVERTGGPEVLSYRDRDPGAPGHGQVRVQVHSAGVNFIDIYFRSGAYPMSLPFVPGMEGAGVVDAVGADVQAFAVGQRVAWAFAVGSYASVALVPAAQLVPVPDGVSDDVAAAAMLQGMTAHYLVHSTRVTRAGDTALVHAAAGGVGLLLVQMLKRCGARVIGTCSTEAKAELARQAGADVVVLYTQHDFAAEVQRWTDGRGVDVVYDSVGKDTFEGSLACLRRRGLLALFGQSSGPVPPLDIQRLNLGGSLFLTRPSLAHYVAERSELEWRASEVFGAIARGALDIRIGARYPLRDAADAHRALESRQTTGKLLLEPDR